MTGSSPLARGLRRRRRRRLAPLRIIPARAGFTRTCRSIPLSSGDHPRSRGVYENSERLYKELSGSSPLARGLRARRSPRGGRPGIIPARAGFTSGPLRTGPARRDHPRSRGVYCGQASAYGDLSGSSPLARGLLTDAVLRIRGGGIIPARAGFTVLSPATAGRARDHPRSRGVYIAP